MSTSVALLQGLCFFSDPPFKMVHFFIPFLPTGLGRRLISSDHLCNHPRSGLYLVLSFIICWTPYALVALVNSFLIPGCLGLWMDAVAPIFAKTSSCFTAFLFIVSNERYKEAFFDLLYCRRQQRPAVVGKVLNVYRPTCLPPSDPMSTTKSDAPLSLG